MTGYLNVFGQALTYSYDAESRLTKREDSLGGVLTSTYDNASRLTKREFGGVSQTEVRFDFAYTDRNELSTLARHSSLAGSLVGTTSYGRDDAGRLTAITNKDGSNATLSYYNYAYDNADRVTTHTYSSAVGTFTYTGTKTYAYDTTSQLTRDEATSYSYDLNGNRTMAGYATGAANRMSNDGVFTYSYDDEGNLTQRSKDSSLETWYYAYDHRNLLTSVRKTSDGSTNQLLVTYTYDGEGNRVQEDKWKSGGSTGSTRFALDGWSTWAELDGSNALLIRYVDDGTHTGVLSRTEGGTVYWLLADNLGSVRDVQAASALVDHVEYASFGEITTEHNTSVGGVVLYTGQRYDRDTAILLTPTRALSVNTGRWLQEDLIAFQAGDLNLYRYSMNDPLNSTDPVGTQPRPAIDPRVGVPPVAPRGESGPDVTNWFARDIVAHLEHRAWFVARRELALNAGAISPITRAGAMATDLFAYRDQAGDLMAPKWMHFGGPKGPGELNGPAASTVVVADKVIRRNVLGNIMLGVVSDLMPPYFFRNPIRHAYLHTPAGKYAATPRDHHWFALAGELGGEYRADNLAAFGVGHGLASAIRAIPEWRAFANRIALGDVRPLSAADRNALIKAVEAAIRNLFNDEMALARRVGTYSRYYNEATGEKGTISVNALFLIPEIPGGFNTLSIRPSRRIYRGPTSIEYYTRILRPQYEMYREAARNMGQSPMSMPRWLQATRENYINPPFPTLP